MLDCVVRFKGTFQLKILFAKFSQVIKDTPKMPSRVEFGHIKWKDNPGNGHGARLEVSGQQPNWYTNYSTFLPSLKSKLILGPYRSGGSSRGAACLGTAAWLATGRLWEYPGARSQSA